MPPLSENNVRQMRALFELISELKRLAHDTLFVVDASLLAHKNQIAQLNIKGDYGQALTTIRGKAQDLSICTRDWIKAIPRDIPDYLSFEGKMQSMIDALEHLFMTAHNVLVASDSTRAPNTSDRAATTEEDVRDAEDLVACLNTLVNALDVGRDAVVYILPAEEVEEVDPHAGLTTESSSNSDAATGLITAVDTVDTHEDNNAAVDTMEENDDDQAIEDPSNHTPHGPADVPGTLVSLERPEEGNSSPDAMQELLDRIAAAFGTSEDVMNTPIGSLRNRATGDTSPTANQTTESEGQHAMESENENEPSLEPKTNHDDEH